MVDFDRVRRIALGLPGTEAAASWGTPSVKAKGTMLVRQYEDPDLVVLKIPFGDREALRQERPDVFLVTDHFEPHSFVLVRSDALDDDELRELLVEGWRMCVTKAMARAFDESEGR